MGDRGGHFAQERYPIEALEISLGLLQSLLRLPPLSNIVIGFEDYGRPSLLIPLQ